jgi:hypothetical protein
MSAPVGVIVIPGAAERDTAKATLRIIIEDRETSR